MIGDLSTDLLLFVAASFAGALVAGMAGFAFGLIASALWLHVISPADSAPLIAAFAIIVQGMSLWALRQSISVRRLMPYLLGSAVGVPLGVMALGLVSADHMRASIGVVLVLFSLYTLARPKLALAPGGIVQEGVVGVASGVFMTVRYTGGIAAAGLAAAVASSGAFRTGFVVLAVAAVLSVVSAGALARTGTPREQAAASA